MKDIHNHLLYGIDDGASSIEDSVYLIEQLYNRGFTDLILTPHYVEDTKYNYNNNEKEKRLEELKKELSLRNININLYIGNEIFITDNIKELLRSNKASTLSNSKYLLIEFSIFYKLSNDIDILLDLIKKGYTPVLAHPERYQYYQDDIDIFRNLVKKGVLLQGDVFSLTDAKGKNARRVLTKLLQEDLIEFLGTDIHKKEDLDLYDKSIIALNKIISKEKQRELFDINVMRVIEEQVVFIGKSNRE